MAKTLLISQEKDAPIIRRKFQSALTKEKFIEELTGEETVTVSETNDKGQVIQSLTINGLKHESVRAIWRINLESEIEGISTKNYFKTPEMALLVLTHVEGHVTSTLHVILVELKSSLQDNNLENSKPSSSTLEQCEEKFRAAINRVYLLLSINEHKNDRMYKDSTITVVFKAIVCYNSNKITKDDGTQLYKILNKLETSNLMTTKSILNDKDKIEMFFHKSGKPLSVTNLGVIK